ncbi:TPA: hypothetical protein N0F65_007655 [Lagenidium giganteum]|uniref:Temptin Cys/Cys disulfide domain-containing protein n=1 Tax=Lagenidium giganteum TaxID=4803 RepID=A0AAV2Z8U9_9STRA|nr:TPA: hypothetical protein N0F65_007655 [Lagenidium giganteum]
MVGIGDRQIWCYSALLVTVLQLQASTSVEAYSKYVKLMPNGDAVPDAPAVGHPDAAGNGGLNEFGKAFKKFGNTWNANLCMEDSDGDWFTNGQELGDPCCKWTPANPGSLITDGISHPSDKTKTPSNEELKKGCKAAGGSAAGGGAAGGGANGTDAGGAIPGAPSPKAGGKPPDDGKEDDAALTAKSSAVSYRQAATGAVVAFASVIVLWA